MSLYPADLQRRALMQMAVGLAAAAAVHAPLAQAAAKSPVANGKAGDFDFLSGEWTIKNRRLVDGKWDEFEGESSVFPLLNGTVSVEELRIPARNFSGMGLRILDVHQKLWADYWVNSKNGVMGGSPTWGSFVDGVGVWDADDTDGEQKIIARGVWDQITPKSCRWYQAVSRDDGATWQENWVMHWQRKL